MGLPMIPKPMNPICATVFPFSLGRQLWRHARVEHRHQADRQREDHAVLQSEADQPAFVLRLHIRRGGGYRDARQADHLAHHPAELAEAIRTWFSPSLV